jgi:hypothetical protein
LIDEIEPKYSNYLCFTVSVRTNRLMPRYNRWSLQQEETIQLVRTLRKEGLGYRKIAKHLNQIGLTTARNTSWTNTKVFSFLKRNKERQDRLAFIEKEYEPVWGKMEVRWEKNAYIILNTLNKKNV